MNDSRLSRKFHPAVVRNLQLLMIKVSGKFSNEINRITIFNQNSINLLTSYTTLNLDQLIHGKWFLIPIYHLQSRHFCWMEPHLVVGF